MHFWGVFNTQVNKLQRIQNISARIVTRSRKQEHIKPILYRLHWLPIHHRIQFKILLLVYKSLNDASPLYISDLIKEYIPTRNLRSNNQNLLQISRTNTNFYGERAFGTIAARLWNSIPLHIRNAPSVDSFKRALKTFMLSH